MFPRADGILLGGTFELDQWDARPQPDDDRPHPRLAQALLRALSAAPLEAARRRLQYIWQMNYQTSVPRSGGDAAPKCSRTS